MLSMVAVVKALAFKLGGQPCHDCDHHRLRKCAYILSTSTKNAVIRPDYIANHTHYFCLTFHWFIFSS